MEDEIADHKMHSEWYSISEETAQRIRETKAAGHRVIAVGTTSCRTLEAVAAKYGEIKACSGNTSIFLYPGVKFNCIDGLITNFHLPESTLIMLVSALYGYEKTMAAYKVAVEQNVIASSVLAMRCLYEAGTTRKIKSNEKVQKPCGFLDFFLIRRFCTKIVVQCRF